MKKRSISELFIECLFGLQIIAAPVAICLGFGLVAYYYFNGLVGNVICLLFILCGLITGVILLMKIWRKEDPVSFMSRVSRTTEIVTDKKHARKDRNQHSG